MCLTIRCQTDQTCFRSSELVAKTTVTWYLSLFNWVIIFSCNRIFLEILHNFLKFYVDAKFEPLVELLVAQWTLTVLFVLPVPADTGLAEVVSTWNRNGLRENIQTDGAQELIFRQEAASCGHILSRGEEKSSFKGNNIINSSHRYLWAWKTTWPISLHVISMNILQYLNIILYIYILSRVELHLLGCGCTALFPLFVCKCTNWNVFTSCSGLCKATVKFHFSVNDARGRLLPSALPTRH